MLSKVSLLLLGIIDQTEINAYELIKVLKKMQVKNWFQIADSTVYVTLRNLNKNDFIEGYSIKDNNMPEKIYYKITEKGRTELKSNIEEIISGFSYDPIPFFIASFFVTVIEQNKAIGLLEKRLDLLKKYSQGIEAQIERIKLEKAKSMYICNIKHNKMILDNEINITNVFLGEIRTEETWDIDALKKMIIE